MSITELRVDAEAADGRGQELAGNEFTVNATKLQSSHNAPFTQTYLPLSRTRPGKETNAKDSVADLSVLLCNVLNAERLIRDYYRPGTRFIVTTRRLSTRRADTR